MNLLIFRVALGVFAGLCLIFASIPSLKSSLRNLVIKGETIVLSTIKRDYFSDGRTIVFAKIKTPQGLFVEIYEQVTNGEQLRMGRIKLPDDNDGFFHVRGQATNLALEDVNGDGRPEILAPSFDANHVAHLNVYTYDSDAQKFKALAPKINH